jgi:hypothetical protein
MTELGSPKPSQPASPHLGNSQEEDRAKDKNEDAKLFENGPPLEIQRQIGLIKGENLNVGRRAALVILVGWVPLVLLSAAQSVLLHTDSNMSLAWEIGAHARYLVAAPLLIVAERGCASRLSEIVRNFIDSGIVREDDRRTFDLAIASTRSWLTSRALEIAVVAVAYIIVAATIWSTPIEQVPAWHKTGGIAPVYSPAGWWHMLCSLPLLLILLLGWLVRLGLWVRLLWLISRLNLRLVASHPDHAAGLAFVGHSVRGFSAVALALTTIAAGKSAHTVLLGGTLPTPYLVFNIGFILGIAVIFTAPLLIFSPAMMNVLRHAVLQYGTLADQVGVAFEDKWLGRSRVDETILQQPDFSATTDLYGVIANIYAMRPVPIDFMSLAMFVVVMLLPFIPVVLLVVPIDQVFAALKSLLL